MMITHLRRNIKLLVINPNSSHEMTDGMTKAIERMNLPDSLDIFTYTAPQNSPASINDGHDIEASTVAVLDDVNKTEDSLSSYDGILIACYSVHSLVTELAKDASSKPPLITGIFEASVLTAMSLLPPNSHGSSTNSLWGIVTTGKFWEQHLTDGVKNFLGSQAQSSKFAGVQSTGLDAGDFHSVDPEEVRQKLRDATQRLLESGDVRCVVMGCAGMAGLEDIIRRVAIDMYGKERGHKVAIVDGVKAGVLQLELAIKSRTIFEG